MACASDSVDGVERAEGKRVCREPRPGPVGCRFSSARRSFAAAIGGGYLAVRLGSGAGEDVRWTVTRLTRSPAIENRPSLSPDGRESDVYLMRRER